ncbi:DNA-3-methyladenine glycosylase [Fodinibius salinus]|uniref:Putative 3-methyladenine DNA glycosylase n=1 Tax=Fodinibius salinus TaxID=860790 RepID=A0A5D3YMX3_9BACT|nr:DNA-3-methyladenine glycosylase [Fodinibius salinus]TYP94051.1 DNA-3-methyladenine glycosylase [Fodinibius salinus]
MHGSKIPLSFYRQSDVVNVAQQLVGKVLCTNINGQKTSGIITETEAYCGRGDQACHASGGTRTKRTETMYQPGGIAYIYLCYGIHHLFNVVTNVKDKADAVLIRAVKPFEGEDIMLHRRNANAHTPALTAGPGRLTEALGINTDYDSTSLSGKSIWIEKHDTSIGSDNLTATSRIGVDYAGDDASLPWRFYPKNCSWISQK